MKGDLHIHSEISDGSMSENEIIIRAKEEGITHLSITNHDTIEGIEETIRLGVENGIVTIPGIEISAYDFNRKRKVHILGYNFDLEGRHIKLCCEETLKKRNENSLRQLNAIIAEGYDIDKWDVIDKVKGGVLYKQHIMEALIKAGYTDNIYSYLYRKLFKGNGICKGDINYVDAKEAVEAIKKDGGIAVVAHPGEFDSFEIVRELVSYGLDGIERNHPRNKIKDKILIDKIAYEFNLIKTGGSDFHGTYGSAVNLGEAYCPEEALIKIINNQIKIKVI